jgi:hypothetical protein
MLALYATALLFGAGPAQASMACELKNIAGEPKSAPDRAAAGALARKAWKNRVAAGRGPIWSNWNVAKDRSIRCAAKGGRMECRARARPCKELGSLGGEDGSGAGYKLVH